MKSLKIQRKDSVNAYCIIFFLICYHVYRKPQINYVNGMLRSIDRNGQAELEQNTSIYDNIANWLSREWIDIYGKETTHHIIETSMEQSPIFISVNYEPNSTDEERIEKLKLFSKHFSTENNSAQLLPHGSIEVPKDLYGGAVSKWPFYNEGEWWVQDPSASLPAIALKNALLKDKPQEAKEMHVVDLCSAPGGKTAQLCSFGFGKVTAVEVSKRRTKTLRDNMQRLGMNGIFEAVVADGREWVPSTCGSVQGVLVDVPCSATGVGSRRPDVLRKHVDTVDELTTTQRELAIHTADNILEPGGIMVYATCSLLKRESEDQIKWLLSRKDGAKMETLPITPGEIPGFENAIDENGWLRVIPGVLPGSLKYCDGFFVARLRRIK
jgi:16S rRNA (cytosine967-C5)-methyltransferase